MNKAVFFLLSLFLQAFIVSVSVAGDTELRLYRPFDDNLNQITPLASQSFKGTCFAQSKRDVREDAWRCEANGKMFDPCFVKGGDDSQELLCPASPWQAEAVVIVVDKPLDASSHLALDMSEGYPWAVEMQSGVKCQALGDENLAFDNQPVRYRCQDNSYLVGRFARCKTEWQVLKTEHNGARLQNIKRVWF